MNLRSRIRHGITHKTSLYILLSLILILSLFLFGCSSSADAAAGKSTSKKSDTSASSGTPRDATAKVLVPDASGATVFRNDIVAVDASNVSQGYIMVNYSGYNDKVKLQVLIPDGTDYTYLVTDLNQYAVYPLTGGDGTYTINILESVDVNSDMYSIAFTQTIDVKLADEFLPYLYPNHYSNFTADSASVKKGSELAGDCYSDLDVVGNIYNYVIKNVTYDDAKAQDLPYGYTPNPDDTLKSGTGICFDYASLMTTMLRSQSIPTKLEVGYSGEVYHAWISCYVDEIGWVDDIIEFDGKDWSLMDPTLAASNKKSAVKKYIGDGSKYTVKYTY